MSAHLSYMNAAEIARKRTGLIVPTYLPMAADREASEALLRETVRSCLGQVEDPRLVCVAVDGEANGGDTGRALGNEFGVQVVVMPASLGKLNPCRGGAALLLERSDVQYVAVIDQDADHFANEVTNFVRAAEHIRVQQACTDRILVLGQRASLHRSLGFLRGEYEALADRVLMDALAYHAARTGRPLRLEYSSLLGDVPDFHSGYKLFSRAAAEAVFHGEPHLAGVTGDCYWRHAPEAVMSVEPLLAGAWIGVVNRSGFNVQPISMFGRLDRAQLAADMIVWPCKRLNVPLPFIRQWLANHMPQLLLPTLAPEGRAELRRVRELVLREWPGHPADEVRPSCEPLFL